MKDAQSKVNIENINNYLKLSPLLLGGEGGGLLAQSSEFREADN